MGTGIWPLACKRITGILPNRLPLFNMHQVKQTLPNQIYRYPDSPSVMGSRSKRLPTRIRVKESMGTNSTTNPSKVEIMGYGPPHQDSSSTNPTKWVGKLLDRVYHIVPSSSPTPPYPTNLGSSVSTSTATQLVRNMRLKQPYS
ncbi:hypothetical protein G9A89_000247 [Geosiphon pyriformis]|nr:hypothetical protein G9A89_000247 [Geosiphon pyriformis]